MKTLATMGFVAALGLVASGPALAECDVLQGNMVGKAVARTAQKDIHPISPSARPPVIDILTCEGGSREFETRFRYSQIASDGQIVWIEGWARGKDDVVSEVHYRKASASLQALVETPKRMAGM